MSVARPFCLSLSIRCFGRRLRWRFNRKQLMTRLFWWVGFPLVLFNTYALAMLPLAYFLTWLGLGSNPTTNYIVHTIYFPVLWACENSTWVAKFYEGYYELVDKLIGWP
ncbi:hypothetical protein GC163_15295 [bacterium]|nr:hypothetical protein [bacterium]